MNTDNFDQEFGENRILRCPKCKSKLDTDQICWCVDIIVNDEENEEC